MPKGPRPAKDDFYDPWGASVNNPRMIHIPRILGLCYEAAWRLLH